MVAWWVIPAIQAGIQLLSSAGSASSAKKQEKAYNDYKKKVEVAAWENYRYQTRAIKNRYGEEAEASAYQLQEIKNKNLQAKATALASAAGSGVTGSTIDNLFREYDRANATSNFIASRNLYLKRLQTYDEMDASRIQALNAINTAGQYTGQTSTSIMLSGLGQAFNTYASAYQQEYQLKNPWGNQKVQT